MPFVQKNIRQNARHCFQCVLFLKYWLFAGGGFDFCTIMWQNKRRVATSSPDILPKDGETNFNTLFFCYPAHLAENPICVIRIDTRK
jgi:hypothetical protein